MPPFRIMKMSLFFLFQIHIMDKSYIIAFWSPIQTLHPQFCLDYFIPLLQKFGDIQCIDFQSRQDPRTMHLLQQADLVVIGLPADSAYFYSFFCEHWISFSNVRNPGLFSMSAARNRSLVSSIPHSGTVCSEIPIQCSFSGNTAARKVFFPALSAKVDFSFHNGKPASFSHRTSLRCPAHPEYTG